MTAQKAPQWNELYEVASSQEGHFSTRHLALLASVRELHATKVRAALRQT